ncbi:hypothetical protein Tco_0022791 [Tanacetum coccineum]
MMMVVPVEEVYVEALQVKYPIIDWEVYSEDTRRIWLRRGSVKQSLQVIKRRNCGLIRRDCLSLIMMILYGSYDTCGVHHVSSVRGHEIFMLVEKEYPLKRGLMTVMLAIKLQVDQYSETANELLRKIFILANKPRH